MHLRVGLLTVYEVFHKHRLELVLAMNRLARFRARADLLLSLGLPPRRTFIHNGRA